MVFPASKPRSQVDHHWMAVRENAASVLSVAVNESLTLLGQVAECERMPVVAIDSFVVAASGLSKFQGVRVMKPAKDLISECWGPSRF